MSYTWDQVVAWMGLVIPFCALAWASVQFVKTQRREQAYLEYKKFFEIMKELGSQESTVSGNMAAVFELRKFPEYRDVIIRLCEDAPLQGESVKSLKREMELTAAAMKVL